MPEITFTIDKDIKNNAPELIDKLNHVSSADEMNDLWESFDCYDIIDAIYAIGDEEGITYGGYDEDSVMEVLWNCFYENYYRDIINDYVAKCMTLKSKATAADGVKIAVQVGWDKVLLVYARDDGGWDYRLLYTNGNEIDAGGVYDDDEKPLGELIEEVLSDYNLSADDSWKLCDFDYYNDK